MIKKQTGMILATAVGILFTTASFADTSMSNAQLAADQVKCSGINSCKGMSTCKTASNACKGMNQCKGQGITMTDTTKTCMDKGGTVVTG